MYGKFVGEGQALPLQKEKMIANVINSSANKNNAAVLQKEPSVVLLRGLLGWRGLVQRSLSLATDKVERILNILESQSKAIYDRSSLVAIQLPLLKGAKCDSARRGIVRNMALQCGIAGERDDEVFAVANIFSCFKKIFRKPLDFCKFIC